MIARAGTKATTAVYNALVFGLMPPVLELPLVCAALGACSSPAIGAVAAATSAAFVAYTLALAQVAPLGLISTRSRAEAKILKSTGARLRSYAYTRPAQFDSETIY